VFRLKRWWHVDALREDVGWVVAHYRALPERALLTLIVFAACAIATVWRSAFPTAHDLGAAREKMFRDRHAIVFGAREAMFRNRHAIHSALGEWIFRAHIAMEEKRFRFRHAIVHSMRSIRIKGAITNKLKRAILRSIAKAFGISIDEAALRIRRLRGLDSARPCKVITGRSPCVETAGP
jgi:hypothetical protein